MADTKELGYTIPEILVPSTGVNMEKWSCVACDQFTSQPAYWSSVEKYVGTAPSTLHIMLPEIYLEDPDVDDRIVRMKQVMHEYLSTNVVGALPRGVVLTVRHLSGGKVRKGVLLAMDLEQYDYDISRRPMIRATEQTVLARIPARVRIRRDAPLEMPHIMLLMDDPEDEAIGGLYRQKSQLKKIYDFELMKDGGHSEGYFTDDPALVDAMTAAISRLKRRENMLFCVGDGNHSLATAKTIWDEAKQGLTDEERENHPLRYALCEVINLRDRAVEFMPIHRMLFHVNPSTCAQYVVEQLKERGRQAKLVFGRWNPATSTEEGSYVIPFLYHDGAGKIIIENPQHPLAIGEVQDIFEAFIAQTKNSSIDYIHGDEAFRELASTKYDTIGFYFDALKKPAFFDLVIQCGVLPKKTFSLGEAEEKRYYMECRRLTGTETGE